MVAVAQGKKKGDDISESSLIDHITEHLQPQSQERKDTNFVSIQHRDRTSEGTLSDFLLLLVMTSFSY